MNAFVYFSFLLITPSSPWGTVVRCPVGVDVRQGLGLYSQVLDSVVSTGIPWVRMTATPPGWIQDNNLQYNFEYADSYYVRLQEHNLNVVAMWWPNKETNKYSDYETRWKDFWNTVVEHYDGDGINDMPGLRKPIKHWYICYEPGVELEQPCRRDGDPILTDVMYQLKDYGIDKPLDSVAVRLGSRDVWRTTVPCYTVNPHFDQCVPYMNNWNQLYDSVRTFFYRYVRVSANAIHTQDPTAKVIAPGAEENFCWSAIVRDCNNNVGYISFWYAPKSNDPDYKREWLDFLENVGDCVDIIGMQTYFALPMNTLLEIKKLCNSFYAENKRPFWIMELGWKFTGVANKKKIFLETAEDVVAYCYRDVIFEWAKNIKEGKLSYEDKIFLYKFWDESPDNVRPYYREDNMGALNNKFEPRPAYKTIKEAIIKSGL